MSSPLYKQVREGLQRRITDGDVRAGDRLPSERVLTEQFGVARSVVRQALAALSRDGWIVSMYPRGYVVLGPRIPWLSRLKLLTDEPWRVAITDVREDRAPEAIAEALQVAPGSPAARRESEMWGTTSKQAWGGGVSWYPLDAVDDKGRTILLDPGELGDDDLERAFARRIIGYHERISARMPTKAERERLQFTANQPVLEIIRISRTTTSPISVFGFAARADRFAADYLIQA